MNSVEMEELWAAKMAQHLLVVAAKPYYLTMVLGTTRWKERLLQVFLTSTHINLSPTPSHQKTFLFIFFLLFKEGTVT